MPTFMSIQEHRRTMNVRLRKLRQSRITTAKRAAKYMVLQAKKLVPICTRETLRSIKSRKRGKRWVVESFVKGRFKQNLFANQTAPFRTLRFKKKSNSPVYANNQRVVYGKPAKAKSGKPIKWTAKPRFFHFATLRTRPYFWRVATANTRKILRTKF